MQPSGERRRHAAPGTGSENVSHEGVVEGLEIAAVGEVRRHVHDIGSTATGRLERRREVRERPPRLAREVVGDDLAALVGRDDPGDVDIAVGDGGRGVRDVEPTAGRARGVPGTRHRAASYAGGVAARAAAASATRGHRDADRDAPVLREVLLVRA